MSSVVAVVAKYSIHRSIRLSEAPVGTVAWRSSRAESLAITRQRGVTFDAAVIVHPARFKGIAPRLPSVPLAA